MKKRKANYAVVSPTGGDYPNTVVKTSRQILDGAESEADFQKKVIALAKMCGWKVFSVRQSAIEGKQLKWVKDRKTGQPKQVAVRVSNVTSEGYPDLTLVRGGKLIFWELKAEDGVVSEEQGEWIMALRLVATKAAVVRPHDWEYIRETLQGA